MSSDRRPKSSIPFLGIGDRGLEVVSRRVDSALDAIEHPRSRLSTALHIPGLVALVGARIEELLTPEGEDGKDLEALDERRREDFKRLGIQNGR